MKCNLKLSKMPLAIILILLIHVSIVWPEGKLIENWLVLGSFQCDTIDQALDIPFLNNEPHIFPDEGEYEAGAGYIWSVRQANASGILDFLKMKLPYSTYCVVYAATYIYSKQEKNVNLLVGSDDGIAMWMNGNQIHNKVVYRGVNRADDTVPVRLSPGWNRLLAKVFNAAGEFGLITEIVESDNATPADLKYATRKPERFKPKGIRPFPFISSAKLGSSYLRGDSRQRFYPIEVTVRNLGSDKDEQCDIFLTWDSNQSTSSTFKMKNMASVSIPLTSENLSDALSTGINIESYVKNKKYDEKLLQIEPVDIFESVFSSENIPAEVKELRSLAENLSENLHWYKFFTGKELHQKEEFLMNATHAILNEDWSAFRQINEDYTSELNEFSQEIKKDTLHLIGQSHIDIAWKWRWPETIEVCRHTYESALNFFDEVPEFKYVQSQAVTFTWMEEHYPELFNALKQKVKENHFFLVGGMWVEPDLNVPNGESLVRQILYGKRYFREKFDVDCIVGYTPDTFGYTWTLPQILSKAGFKYFVTTKIWWNDTTEFPYQIFWWVSPDGSRVLTCFPLNLNVSLDLVENANSLTKFKKKGITDLPLLYGVGDHGGGPTRAHFDKAEKMESLMAYPTTYHNDLRSYMERIDRKYTDLPVWNDELYLEYHRGTMTTQALIKKRNRQSEIWLEEAEKLAVFSGMNYPQTQLEDAWKKMLFNQFHDILPGSSIPEVYIDANETYDAVEETTQRIIGAAMQEIVAKVDTRGNGLPVVVFNPLSWNRTDLVSVSVSSNIKVGEIVDKQNNSCIFQQNENHLLFVAKDVPQNGYKTFWLREGHPKKKINNLKISETSLENAIFLVEINPDNGNIRRMIDKINKREVMVEGNKLQFFEDLPDRHDAWNIGYTGKQWEVDKVEKIEIIESGPVRAILRCKRIFQNSAFVQDYIIYQDVPRLDIQTLADWHEHHVLLKATFPVAVQADVATYEIAYGTIQRTTNPATEADKAKWEVSAHKFVDLSDSDYGISLLNDCKYGHDIVGNTMRITLLRSPKTPDPIKLPKGYENPYADMGEHEFVYSLYPHSGDFRKAFSYRRAYELNYPLLAELTETHEGDFDAEYSFVILEPGNLVLSVIKKAEDSNAKIVRVYEIHGQSAKAKLTFSWPVKNAWETNLMEERNKQLQVDKNVIRFSVEPFEIVTIEVDW